MAAAVIREALDADTPQLVEMGVHFLRSHYAGTLAENPAQMEKTVGKVLTGEIPGRVLVAEQDERLIGMLVFIVTEHHFSGELAATEMVWWVEPTARGRIGLDLLREAERLAAQMGAKQMHMISPSEDTNTIYRRCGYQQVEWSFSKPLAMVEVFDGVLPEPDAYRSAVLSSPFRSVSVGPDTFHGIAEAPDDSLLRWFVTRFPQYKPTLTFLRKSPLGQKEPNFIHTDEGMGDVTAILYLNPRPAADDGTAFWKQKVTGKREGSVVGEAGKDLSAWERWRTVPAVFNRAVVFAAPLFHSRSIEANYGEGEDARLIQVLFARR